MTENAPTNAPTDAYEQNPNAGSTVPGTPGGVPIELPPHTNDFVVDTDEEVIDMDDFDLEDMYASDANLELGGVPVRVGKVVFGLARAGGANTAYTSLMTQKTMPYRRLLQNLESNPKKMDKKVLKLIRRLEMETLAEACVKWWKHDDLGMNKLYGLNKEVIEFSPENAVKLFNQMGGLFDMLSDRAKDLFNFKEAVEGDAKNS